MTLLKAIGAALLSAVIVALALFGGFVFSVVSTIVTIALAIGGLFLLVYYIIWEAVTGSKKQR